MQVGRISYTTKKEVPDSQFIDQTGPFWIEQGDIRTWYFRAGRWCVRLWRSPIWHFTEGD